MLPRLQPLIFFVKFKRVASNFHPCTMEAPLSASDLGIIRTTVTSNLRTTASQLAIFTQGKLLIHYLLPLHSISSIVCAIASSLESRRTSVQTTTSPSHSSQLLVDDVGERPVLRWASTFSSAVFTWAADVESSSRHPNQQDGVNINKA